MIKYTFYIGIVLLLFASCKGPIHPDELYGKWKYISVEHPNSGSPTLTGSDLESASIEFSKNNGYVILWGGKVLSHGRFATDGRNIRITESLPDGTTRAFPFWISELSDKEIVFETTGDDGAKVTAVKE